MKDKPWLDPDTIKWLDSKSFDWVFEWGSGGSTLYFSKKAKKVISLEHDEKWLKKLSSELSDRQILNVTLRHIPYDGSGSNHMDVNACTSNSFHLKNKRFHTYVHAIDSYSDSKFDLILVDGRSRISCVFHAIPKLKKGGYLVLDDSHRDYYEPAIELLKMWPCIEFKGPHRTRIWTKP